MNDELIRRLRTAVQGFVAAAVEVVAAWVLMKWGIELPTTEITFVVMGAVFPFVLYATTALVAWVEQRVPVVGVLNGPRRDVTYYPQIT